jgi:hypothetical protein
MYKRVGKDFPSKHSLKASMSSYSHIEQSRLQTKFSQKRQRRLLHIDEGNNPSGEYKNYKHICSECQCTQFHKGNTIGHKNSDRLKHNNSE